MTLVWTPDYSTGISAIDDQHRELFKLINELSKLEDSGGRDEVKLAIKRLEAYVFYHFSSEEHLMAKAGYENLERHVGEHDKFRSKVSGFRESLEKGGDAPEHLLQEIVGFLEDWLMDHVLHKDRKFGPVIAERLKDDPLFWDIL